MYTQADCDADVGHYERERAQLRALFLAGQVAEAEIKTLAEGIAYRLGPRRLDGLEYRDRDNELVRKIERCQGRVQASRFFTGQRLRDREKAKFSNDRWHSVKSEADALAMKHRGHKVRNLGVNKWEVQG